MNPLDNGLCPRRAPHTTTGSTPPSPPERSRQPCTRCCPGRLASMPCLRPPRPSLGTPEANELPQERLTTSQTKGSFLSHLTWWKKTCGPPKCNLLQCWTCAVLPSFKNSYCERNVKNIISSTLYMSLVQFVMIFLNHTAFLHFSKWSFLLGIPLGQPLQRSLRSKLFPQ